jgi:hypothetical protein
MQSKNNIQSFGCQRPKVHREIIISAHPQEYVHSEKVCILGVEMIEAGEEIASVRTHYETRQIKTSQSPQSTALELGVLLLFRNRSASEELGHADETRA